MAGSIFLSNGLAAATLWYGGHLILNDRIAGDSLIPFVLYQLNLGEVILKKNTENFVILEYYSECTWKPSGQT
jgi:hypothetical protein